jgi:hypothetical protein
MLIGDQHRPLHGERCDAGVDYLVSRKDVDAARIGAFGCSGGGTSRHYFAALDDRVKVAATACYITSFNELLASPTGAQDAEQSFHISSNRVWISRTGSRPSPETVRRHFDDGRHVSVRRRAPDRGRSEAVLRTYSAEDKIRWITGPGGHGNLGPVSPAIMKFFTVNLKGSSDEPSFTTLRAPTPTATIVTNSGQVSTEFRDPSSVHT